MFHQSQFPATPFSATMPVTASGVSAANVVATIDVPASHHGNDRPETKNSDTFLPARRVYASPTAAESRKYAPTMIQSRDVIGSGSPAIPQSCVGDPFAWRYDRIGNGDLNGIVHGAAQRHVLLILAPGIHAIGQEHHEQIALKVDPQAGAGEPGVADRFGGEEVAAGGAEAAGRGHVPADGAAREIVLLRAQAVDRRRVEQSFRAVEPVVQQHLREHGKVPCGGKKARVAGYAADGERILVVHAAMHVLFAKQRVDLGRSDAGEQVVALRRSRTAARGQTDRLSQWVVHGLAQPEPVEEPGPQEFIDSLSRKPLDDE